MASNSKVAGFTTGMAGGIVSGLALARQFKKLMDAYNADKIKAAKVDKVNGVQEPPASKETPPVATDAAQPAAGVEVKPIEEPTVEAKPLSAASDTYSTDDWNNAPSSTALSPAEATPMAPPPIPEVPEIPVTNVGG